MNLKNRSIFALFLLTALALSAVSCGVGGAGEVKIDRPQEINAVRNSVVRFMLRFKHKDEPERSSYGTGFFVSDRHIVTAHHVGESLTEDQEELGGAARIEIVIRKQSSSSPDQFTVPVTVVAQDEENDIAIYEYAAENIKAQWQDFSIQPLTLADRLPQIGEEILLTGYFNIYTQPFSSIGTVSMITEDNFNAEKITFNQAIFSDLTTIQGHSGGPLYSFRTRRVVGVNTRVLNPNNDRQRISISTNSLHVIKLMATLNSRVDKK